MGFVSSLKTTAMPTYYSAVKLQPALEKYFNYQLEQVRPLLGESGFRLTKIW
jgi:hypothetical protein